MNGVTLNTSTDEAATEFPWDDLEINALIRCAPWFTVPPLPLLSSFEWKSCSAKNSESMPFHCNMKTLHVLPHSSELPVLTAHVCCQLSKWKINLPNWCSYCCYFTQSGLCGCFTRETYNFNGFTWREIRSNVITGEQYSSDSLTWDRFRS